jgi:uncharacterized coiled-coil protein SlyX
MMTTNNNQYRAIRLLRHTRYPTYQLHAAMFSKKTSLEDGLKIAVLTVMEWLRHRITSDIPAGLQLPPPSGFQDVPATAFVSQHYNCGYVLDIVSMLEQGIWSMQIVEPDLGSDPGNPDQEREPVAGRVIETNIGFAVANGQLECGFQTVISDPVGLVQPCDVYRLAIIRELAANPAFGLKQVVPLIDTCQQVATAGQFKNWLALHQDSHNTLPSVFFTQLYQTAELPPMPAPEDFRNFQTTSTKMQDLIAQAKPALPEPNDPDYAMDALAHSGLGFFRTYLLADSLRTRMEKQMKCQIASGDILFIEPRSLGGEMTKFPYKPAVARRLETMGQLKLLGKNYPREKEIPFGAVKFISEAHACQHLQAEEAAQQNAVVSEEYHAHIAGLEAGWKAQIAEKEGQIFSLNAQLCRQKQYQERLEREKEQLYKKLEDTQAALKEAQHTEDIHKRYLQYKVDRPKKHQEIPSWVARYFEGRILMHSRAVSLLNAKDCREIDLDLICDALDFLATDYWEYWFEQLPWDQVLHRCSQKYGRPFDVAQINSRTIESTPREYKIKYYMNERGKRYESALDRHLRVGNDPENLLRIYFLIDEPKRLFVIGSLPRHLRALQVR